MSQQTINIGVAPDDGTGDTARDAFDKCNLNFTELYDVTATALQADGSIDGTGTQKLAKIEIDDYTQSGDVVFGIETETTPGIGLTSVSSYLRAVNNFDNIAPSATSMNYVVESAGSQNALTMNGMAFDVRHGGDGSLNNLNGMLFTVGTKALSSGGITTCNGVSVNASYAGSGTIEKLVGFSIKNLGNVEATTVIGLEIAKQSGATNNYGLALIGDGAGADIVFGANKEISQSFSTYLDFSGSGITHTAQVDTAVTGYVTISIDGTPRKFAIIDP